MNSTHHTMPHFLQSILYCTGYKRYLIACLMGLLSALALPPIFFIPILIPAFTFLLLQLDHVTSRKQAFLLGWCFGFGYFFAGLYWIAISLLVDAAQFAWLIPFCMIGVPGACAIYIGLVTLCTHLTPATGWRKAMAFSVWWVIAEWLRGHLFTGFPWNLIGYSWGLSTSMIQVASITGIYGLSLLTVLLASLPYSVIVKKSWLPVAVMTVFTLIIGIYGSIRLHESPTEQTSIGIRIVQANIPERANETQEQMDDTITQHMALSAQPSSIPIAVVIWPESGIPYDLNNMPGLPAYIRSKLPPGSILITGGMRANWTKTPQLWNSLYIIDTNGHIADVYDKVHLVPFGEYIPFRKYLPINKITAGTIDFISGTGLRTVQIPSLPPFSPLICYEAIFPGEVVAPDTHPKWMVNITNDAWFGRSSGPYQHLQNARFRAVEQGLPMIRAANTGISAIIDSYGRIEDSLGIDEKKVLDHYLPKAAPPTFYARYGDLSLLFILLLLSIAVIFQPRIYKF